MLTKTKSILLLAVMSVAFILPASAEQDNFKWMRSVQQQTVRDYSQGLSAYYENGLWGFISTSGAVVIEPIYEEVSDFDGSYIRVRKDGKWGIITSGNKTLFPCQYDSITSFTEGVALAEANGAKFYLYKNGKIKALPSSYDFFEFSEGFARVRDNKKGKWGYVDLKGVIRINPRFDTASDFKAGHAVVTDNGKTYSINKAGDKHQLPFNPAQKVVVFSNGAGYVENLNGTLSFFTKGFNLTPGEYKEINDFSEGMARVRSVNGSIAYLTEDGTVALRIKGYSDAGDFSEGKTWVKRNSLYGYIDTKGALVIDTLFSYASNFNNQLAYVARGQRQGVIKQRYTNDTFPILDVSDIKLVDNSGNNIVEAEENFDISMVVRNIGDAPLNDAIVVLEVDGKQQIVYKHAVSTIIPARPLKSVNK